MVAGVIGAIGLMCVVSYSDREQDLRVVKYSWRRPACRAGRAASAWWAYRTLLGLVLLLALLEASPVVFAARGWPPTAHHPEHPSPLAPPSVAAAAVAGSQQTQRQYPYQPADCLHTIPSPRLGGTLYRLLAPVKG
jgi:hypothetical protein